MPVNNAMYELRRYSQISSFADALFGFRTVCKSRFRFPCETEAVRHLTFDGDLEGGGGLRSSSYSFGGVGRWKNAVWKQSQYLAKDHTCPLKPKRLELSYC
jgi:hypothetical protein